MYYYALVLCVLSKQLAENGDYTILTLILQSTWVSWKDKNSCIGDIETTPLHFASKSFNVCYVFFMSVCVNVYASRNWIICYTKALLHSILGADME